MKKLSKQRIGVANGRYKRHGETDQTVRYLDTKLKLLRPMMRRAFIAAELKLGVRTIYRVLKLEGSRTVTEGIRRKLQKVCESVLRRATERMETDCRSLHTLLFGGSKVGLVPKLLLWMEMELLTNRLKPRLPVPGGSYRCLPSQNETEDILDLMAEMRMAS